MRMDLHMIMSRVHSTFPDSGGRDQIINVVMQLEKAAVSLTGDIRRLESSIDNSLQGKTRDAFIDRIRQLEKRRQKIEEKIIVLKGSVN
jgi:histidinol phosphatase-like PHP family hydrolase